MRNSLIVVISAAASFCIGFFARSAAIDQSPAAYKSSRLACALQAGYVQSASFINSTNRVNMKLGAFSVSLGVKDINASKAFYESLGFTVFAGSLERKYLIMKNETTLIGIFQGMFEGNMLTFNPGWDHNAKNIDQFDDIREIQKQLKNKGITVSPEADEKTKGPASLMVKDPDGNVILLDQHR